MVVIGQFATAFLMLQAHRSPVLVVGLLAAVLVGAVLGLFGGRTTLTDAGLRIHQWFVPRRLRAWSDVAFVREEQVRSVLVIRVGLRNGKQFLLPHPISAASGDADPVYRAQRDQVLAYWRRHATTATG